MRLCIIANVSIHTQRYLRFFAERGHDVHLLALGRWHVDPPPGVVVHPLTSPSGRPQPGGRLRWIPTALRARRIVRRLRPDLLHAQQIAPAGWLGAASGYHPFLATAWGSDLLVSAQGSPLFRALARWTLSRADYVTCVSGSLAQAALALGAHPDRLAVAPWGVDLSVYHPPADRADLRRRLGLPAGPLLLSVRSVKPVYRPLDVAAAIALVARQLPAAHFLVRTHNSDPALLDRFRTFLDETLPGPAAGAVLYAGDLQDDQAIADLYRAADVALSVPSSDGTPSSVLEALACGAVPVVTDLPSLHEWLEPDRHALFVPVGDVPAIAAAVVRLLSDDALRLPMAAHGASLVRDRADSRLWMARSEDLYRRLAASRRES